VKNFYVLLLCLWCATTSGNTSEIVSEIALYTGNDTSSFLKRVTKATTLYQTVGSAEEWSQLTSMLEARGIPREKIIEWTIIAPENVLWQRPHRLRAIFILCDYFIGAEAVNERWIEDPAPFVGFGYIRRIINRAVNVPNYPKVKSGETRGSEYRRLLFEIAEEEMAFSEAELARRIEDAGLVNFRLALPNGFPPETRVRHPEGRRIRSTPMSKKSSAEILFARYIPGFKPPLNGAADSLVSEAKLRKEIRNATSAEERIRALRKVMARSWIGESATFVTLIQIREGGDPYEVRHEADLTLRAKLCVRTDLSCLAALHVCLDENPLAVE
jgi:hypothetical protein